MSDPDPTPELTPTLAETARRRADLHHALVGVERTISSPAAGRENDWTKDVAVALLDLRAALEEHIEVTERDGGLYEEIRQRAPRLSNKVDHLREEHPEIRDAATALIDRLESDGVGDMWLLEDARNELQRLLGRVVRHRQLGADLVWEAYNLDIGGIE